MPFLAPLIGAIGAAITAVGSFIAPLTGALGGLGVFGRVLLTIGLNLAMSAAQSLFAKKEKPPPSGVELDLQFGEGGSRKVMCGRFASAGLFVYANAFGPANETLQQVFQLSDFPVTSLDKIWIDGEPATLGAIDPVKGAVVTSGDYANRIWIRLIDGWQTTADAGLVAGANPTGRWTADHVGLGNAYVIVTMDYDREKLTQPPQFLFEGKGAPLYDWRKDSTVGGSGSHRWNDIATWEFTENGILMAYAYHRGIAFNGDLFCGMEVPAGDLPIARWNAAANLCDEIVEGAPRYRCSIGLDCNIEHGDNIEAIMTSCGGMMVNGVGEIFPIVGSDQPIVATLTDDDLVVGEPVRFQARRSMDELVNSVSGTFPNPDNQWGPTSYESARDAGVVATDRRTRDVSINFTTVIYPKQAANLAALYYSENRFEATASFTARPRWQVLEPGDWIIWNSARYGSRTFMVVDAQLKSASSDGPRNAVLSLQERSGDIYAGVGIVVPPIPLGPATPVYAAELQDFTVTAATGLGSDSRAYPTIRCTWTAPTDPTVSGFVLEWRVVAYPDEVQDRTVTIDRTMALITEGLVSQTDYEVRHRLITDPPRVTTPSAWKPVTTTDAPSSDVTVGLAQVKNDVEETLKDLRAELDDYKAHLTDIGASISLAGLANYNTISKVEERTDAAHAAITVEQDVRASTDEAIAAQLTTVEAAVGDNSAKLSQELLTRATDDGVLAASILSLSATVGSNASAITIEQTARADGDSALAADITALTSTVNGNTSAITIEQTARASGDSTNASAITAVNADFNGRFAAGLMKFEAQSAPAGVDARFSVMLKASSGDAFKYAGFYLDLRTVGGVQRSEFVVNADRFVVTDGAANTLPLVYVGGVLKAQNVKFQWADIEGVSIGSAQIADASITNAKIANLTIQTSNIGLGMILATGAMNNSAFPATSTSWTTVATITIDNPSGDFIFIDYTISQSGSRAGGGGTATLTTRFRRVTGDVTIASIFRTIGSGVAGNISGSDTRLMLDQAPTGSVTYAVEYIATGDASSLSPSSTGTVLFKWSKR